MIKHWSSQQACVDLFKQAAKRGGATQQSSGQLQPLTEHLACCSAPSLAVVCNGDLGTVGVYRGDMKAKPLRGYLDGFASGDKCSSMQKLDCSMDFASWKAGKLKQASIRAAADLHNSAKRLLSALACHTLTLAARPGKYWIL